MGKRTAYIALLFIAIAAKTNCQEIQFGWSFGDIGWSYNFVGEHDVVDYNILRFSVSFEKINVMINTFIFSGTNKNNRKETEPFYEFYFPLEIVYAPFKWKYARISAYCRGAWEIGYRGDVKDPQRISDAFFGSLGLKAGLIPMESKLFKYRSHVITVFSEYTIRNELKLGASIDLFDILYLWLNIQKSN
ncbi:MAG: hypothetical protein LBU16_06315 [Treponema sp.]|jgi:hypothetical protein|nr:hypothetical protein [Treponema sp.]